MRDWLTIELVLATLLVTSFTCVGLVALWGATSPRHWFVRTAVVLAMLSPLLLRPMYEPLVTLTTQIVAIVSAVRICSQRAVLWEALRGRRKNLLPRFSMQFVLAATCLVAIVTALAVAATKRLGSTFWITPASLGVVAGVTTLLAAWLTRVIWSWKSLLILLVALGSLSYAYQETDYLKELAPVVNFWPHRWPDSSILPAVVSYLCALAHVASAVALQYAFLLAWRRWLSLESGDRSFRAAPRLLIATTMLLFAAFPVYIVTKLQFPCAIPVEVSFPGDDDRFRDLLALSDSFKGTALWQELCANQVNEQRVTKAVKRQASEFDELHRLLKQPLLRPVTVDWIAERSIYPGADGWRKTMAENSQLSVLAQVLAARSDAGRAEEDAAAAIESALDLLRLAESTSRAIDFSTHLRADAFEEMAIARIYRLLPIINESQCEACIQRLTEMENRREPIAKLLRYYRAQSENEFGWLGHFTALLGDIANRLDSSLDANHTKILQDIDWRSQATVRLLITELLLRRHYVLAYDYPETLDDLAAMAMKRWFADPFTSNRGTFVYRRQNAGYLLYSLGVDRDDDGGRPPGRKEYGGIDWRGDGDLRLDAHLASGSGE